MKKIKVSVIGLGFVGLSLATVNADRQFKTIGIDSDNKKLEKALSAMKSAADTDENLMPYIIASAKAFATTGEISNTFREVFGEYRPKEVF